MESIYILVGLCTVIFVWSCSSVYRYIKDDLDFSDLVKEETMVNRRQQRAVSQRQQNARRVQFNQTYSADSLFEDIPGDDSNVQLTIPQEACEAVGLSPGDSVTVSREDSSIIITKDKD